jgi:diguanylate cyclase (GGDEF)-like protein
MFTGGGNSMGLFDKKKLREVKLEKKEEGMKKHTIMIVDDEEKYLESLEAILSEEYDIITARGGREALEIIEKMDNPAGISLVISDQRMPGLTGIELFEHLLHIIPNTIRIILTSYADAPIIIDAINRTRIYEFITKPFEPEDLKLRIKRAVETFDDKQKIERARINDPLTGLGNRGFLYEFIPSDIAVVDKDFQAWSQDPQKPFPTEKELGFLLLDLDNFGLINNVYGPQTGDEILIQVGNVLRSECPKSNILIRWESDNFLIVNRFSDGKQAQNLAEQLRQALENHRFQSQDGQDIRLTCSIGFAPYPFIQTRPGFAALNWETVLKIAQKACFAASELGGNTWVGIAGAEKAQNEHIQFLSRLDRDQLLDYIKQIRRNNEINVLCPNPELTEPLIRQFFSYGPLDNSEHFYASRQKLIDKAYTQLIGRNPAKGGHYITVWGPRQSGKSWLMREVLFRLQKDPRFSVIKINLEDQKDKENVNEIISSIARKIGEELDKSFTGIDNQEKFQEIFRKGAMEKPLIMILDEFDALAEPAINTLVSAFRNIYITRRDQIHTPTEQKKYLLHGLALIGIRSVLGIGNDKGSPFNVQKSLQIPNLTFNEVNDLFQWYERVTGQEVKAEVVRRLYNETSGQPGLTCWFGELLTEGFKDYTNDGTSPIGEDQFDTVFAAAIDTLPNNNVLNIISKAREEANKDTVLQLFQTDEKLRFRFDDPVISDLYMNGVVDEEKADEKRYFVKFSNAFIQKRLFNYFSGDIFKEMGKLVDPFLDLDHVVTPERLEIRELMKVYQAYLEKNRDWLFKNAPRRSDNRLYEAVFHFNLYAYLDRFLQNKNGSVYPEFPTGNGKIDLVVNYAGTFYGIELKSFVDQATHRLAVKQAARYGKQLNLDEIYLAMFMDHVDEKNRQKLEVDLKDDDTGVTVKPILIRTGNP